MFSRYFKLIIYMLLIIGYANCQQQQMQQQESQQAVYSSGTDGQHASIVQPTMSNFYQNRQAGFASTGTGIVNFLPIAFVAGFGLLLLIPLLLLFFTTGFGPGYGYAGYASRKRSIDDLFEPMLSNLHPVLMNLAKNPTLVDLWTKADKEGLLSNLQPVIMDLVNGKGLKNEQFKNNIHNFINPIIKDVLPSEWRRTFVHLASKLMKTMSDNNLSKNEYIHKNKLDNKAKSKSYLLLIRTIHLEKNNSHFSGKT